MDTAPQTPAVASVDALIALSRRLDAAVAKETRTRKDVATLAKRADKEAALVTEITKEYDAMKAILDAGTAKPSKGK